MPVPAFTRDLRPFAGPLPDPPTLSQPRAALHALGCRLNHAEIDLLSRKLEQAGYRIVPWGQQAELCVLNTCTVTGQADAKSRQALSSIRRRIPGATLAVVGCYAELAAERLAAEGLADLIVGNAEKLRLPELLAAHLGPHSGPGRGGPPSGNGASGDTAPDQSQPRGQPQIVRPRMTREPFRGDWGGTGDSSGNDGGLGAQADGTLAVRRSSLLTGHATRAHLKVQDGCDFMCSFCIIPFARGRSRPREFADLMREAEALAAGGSKEIVLTGVNLGTFLENGRRLEQVVDALDALPGVARLRISSIEPTTVSPGLLERMADRQHRLVPFLHLPLQSGSDAILAAMRRRHTAGQYRDFAESALALVPDLCLGTDIMVGFPGEGDREFEETVAFLEQLPFAYFHVFPYSERPGTPAVRLIEGPAKGPVEGRLERIPPSVRQWRAEQLRRLSDAKRSEFQQRFLGRTVPVLFEQPKTPGLAQGLTANYIRVQVPTPDAAALRNALLPVTLTGVGTGDRARPDAMTGALAGAPLLPLPA